MWGKFLEFWRKISARFQHLLGNKPYIPSDGERGVAEKIIQPEPKSPEKLLALPITNKYEKIDWENNPPKYRKRSGVLSFPERQFHRLLVRSIGRNHQVLSMVRIADVMRLSNETEDYKYHNNNISCKHFDFVICDKLKFEPLLVIELDDPKHQFLHRKQADIFKEKACEEAGLPLLRIKVQNTYNEEELKEKIRQKLASSAQTNESNIDAN